MRSLRRDPLRLYIIHHPDFKNGAILAAEMARYFDAVGFGATETRLSVPVRVLSASATGTSGEPPRDPEFDRADFTGVIFLCDRFLADAAAGPWADYLGRLSEECESKAHSVFRVSVATGGSRLIPGLADDQNAILDHRFKQSEKLSAPLKRALLIRLMNVCGHALTRLARLDGRPERVFLSYARADGEALVRAVKAVLNNVVLNVQPFVDFHDLPPGQMFKPELEQEICQSAFIAFYTDAYGGRPYCQWELITAKRLGRPMIIAQRLVEGEARAFPYAGNAPVTLTPTRGRRGDSVFPDERTDAVGTNIERWYVEGLILDTMSEVLRCLVWKHWAAKICAEAGLDPASTKILPRPPELLDIAQMMLDQSAKSTKILVHPDPPLGAHEQALLTAIASPELKIAPISTLGELV